MVARPVDHRTLAIVAQAQRERYRIEPCPTCGGPYISAKTKAAARCMACGLFRETAGVPRRSWRTCEICRGAMDGLPLHSRYCRPCAGLTPRERAWKREREAKKRNLARTCKYPSISLNVSGPVVMPPGAVPAEGAGSEINVERTGDL